MMLFRLGLALLLAAFPGEAHPPLQHPLKSEPVDAARAVKQAAAPRPLYGRFLHITDIHPDPFYKTYSSTSAEKACHSGSGTAGVYGAEISDCDTPFSLVNETFNWIGENLKDSIDFVIWTGDSARHDNDERYPRSDRQVLELNKEMVNRFVEVFGKLDNINDTNPANDFIIPIVPTFGNNDILPHNILAAGPNKWTKEYLDVWVKFIPEAQRHTFAYGGWFFTEVIPNRLAVFSLNTIYFFDSNSAVDGCADKSEPGYQHMEWLRIQLQFLRQRGMKAIMMGHVPPARTKSKQSWDETCWQKYTLWMKQYRDVVVGGIFGHMNIDHFMLQDEKQLTIVERALEVEEEGIEEQEQRAALEDRLSIQSSTDYLTELREQWSELPTPPSWMPYPSLGGEDPPGSREEINIKKKTKKKKSKKERQDRFLEKIGGEFAERYSVSLVSPSVIPNYFPSLRIIEYNITGIEDLLPTPASQGQPSGSDHDFEMPPHEPEPHSQKDGDHLSKDKKNPEESKKKKKKKPKKPKPPFPMPKSPSPTSPPGPAYSPQTFTFTGIIQYYANLTYINNDFTKKLFTKGEDHGKFTEQSHWRDGPHGDKKTPRKPHPKKLEYQVEYCTKNDSVIGNMPDLTVKSWLRLAERIGQYKPAKGDRMSPGGALDEEGERDYEVTTDEQREHEHREQETDDEFSTAKGGKGKKDKKKDKKRQAINMVWFTFVKRAYVGSMSEEELHQNFGQVIPPAI